MTPNPPIPAAPLSPEELAGMREMLEAAQAEVPGPYRAASVGTPPCSVWQVLYERDGDSWDLFDDPPESVARFHAGAPEMVRRLLATVEALQPASLRLSWESVLRFEEQKRTELEARALAAEAENRRLREVLELQGSRLIDLAREVFQRDVPHDHPLRLEVARRCDAARDVLAALAEGREGEKE